MNGEITRKVQLRHEPEFCSRFVLARSVVVLALVPAPGTAAPAPAVRAVSRLWKKSARTWFPPAAFPAVEVEVEPGVVGTVVVELETPEALC